MKCMFKRLSAGCLALVMLAGCAPAAPAPSSAEGGFVEAEISPPDNKDWSWKSICADEQGAIHIFGVNIDNTGEAVLPQTIRHEVYENGEWQTIPADWAGQLAELYPAPDTDGMYTVTFGVEEDSVWTAVSFTAQANELVKEGNDPEANRLWLFCVQGDKLEGGEVELDNVPPGNLYFTGAVQCGEYLLLPTGCSVLEVNRDGTLEKSYAGQDGALQETGTIVWQDTGTLARCSGSPDEVEIPDWEQVVSPNLLMSSRNGTAYLVGKAGFFRVKDTTMEQLDETKWLRMGSSYYKATGFAVARDDLFYLLDPMGKVYQYQYDPEHTVVEEAIRVQSLVKNANVSAAVSEMAREHREITAEYETLMESIGMTDKVYLSDMRGAEFSYANYEDTVRNLYDSIAAGNGPDVLILDNLDAAALMEQGMLADLSELIDTSVVYPALREAFAQDGKQYGLPTQFYPWIVGSIGDMPQMDTFDDLGNAILAGKAMGDDKQVQHPVPGETVRAFEGVTITMTEYGDLFPMLYSAWQQKLLDGDRSTIQAFLQQGKQLGEHMNLKDFVFEPYMRANFSQQYFGLTSMFCSPMLYPSDLMSRCGTAPYYSSSDDPTTHIALMPDTQGNTLCQPGTVDAIPANSQHKEAAARFIEALLSESVQTSPLVNEGFPAVPEYLQARFDYTNSYNTEDRTLQEDPMKLFEQMDLCIPDDPLLEGRLLQAASGYWVGEQTLDEATDNIQTLLQTMRAEQQ